MIKREEAINFLNQKITNRNIVKHMFATEALMGGVYDILASRGVTDLGGTKEEWMIAGLLHDGDYYEGVPEEKQGIQVVEELRKKGYEIPDNVAYAMAAHNAATGIVPKSFMDWTIFLGDSLTGLIVASALVLPSRKLADVTNDMVLRRFKEKSFAKGTRRENILMCEEKLGLKLPEFIEVCLSSMQKIHETFGL